MSVKRSRPPGRPSHAERALWNWAFEVAKDLELYQQELDFVASGASLDMYEVAITKKNQVSLSWADYLKYSTAGRGRKPGGGMAPIEAIVDWLKVKGIQPEEGTIEGMAWAIAKKQQQEGNYVHRGKRPGLPVELVINESFDRIGDQLAFEVAQGVADDFIKNINSYKK